MKYGTLLTIVVLSLLLVSCSDKAETTSNDSQDTEGTSLMNAPYPENIDQAFPWEVSHEQV